MKFKCGPTMAEYKEKRESIMQWHDHFALWPREVRTADCRWLEVIQRKRIVSEYNILSWWIYRSKT